MGKQENIISKLPKNISDVIGPYCTERFEVFTKYPDNWGGEGKSLSPESVETFKTFILENQSIICSPSIFLTRAGNLQLSWDNIEYGYIEVEMFSNHFEYWIEDTDVTGILLMSDVSNFISILKITL